MLTFSSGSIPLFITTAGVGGQASAQIRFFDVYYTTPPVVGFHVIGEDIL